MPFPLAKAVRWAEKIKGELAPLCDRIEIAGSIRRARELVNDIDLVLVAKDEAAVRARCKAAATPLRQGSCNASYMLQNGCQLDLFFAQPARGELFLRVPGNLGSVLLCRTGSKEHNIMLVERAKARGLAWKLSSGICRLKPNGDVMEILAGQTEEEMFEALGMEWIPPVLREVEAGRSAQPLGAILAGAMGGTPGAIPAASEEGTPKAAGTAAVR